MNLQCMKIVPIWYSWNSSFVDTLPWRACVPWLTLNFQLMPWENIRKLSLVLWRFVLIIVGEVLFPKFLLLLVFSLSLSLSSLSTSNSERRALSQYLVDTVNEQWIGTLSKRGWQWQCQEARKIFLRNPLISLSVSLLWLPCMFLFSLKLLWFQCLLLNETMDVSSWNIGQILKTVLKQFWSSWSLIWEQNGTNVSYISDIHTCALFVLCN